MAGGASVACSARFTVVSPRESGQRPRAPRLPMGHPMVGNTLHLVIILGLAAMVCCAETASPSSYSSEGETERPRRAPDASPPSDGLGGPEGTAGSDGLSATAVCGELAPPMDLPAVEPF